MTSVHDTSQPIDFNQARAAAAEAQVAVTGSAAPLPVRMKLVIGRREYDLVPKLSALDAAIIQEAFDSDSVREIVTSMQRLVPKHQRDALVGYLLGDPDDDDDRVSIDDIFEAYKSAQEQIAARPTGK